MFLNAAKTRYKIASNTESTGFIARIPTQSPDDNLYIDWFHDIDSDSFSCLTSIAAAKDSGLYITGVSKSDYTFLGNNYTINPNYVNHFYAKISGLNKEITYDGSMYTATETQATTYQWLDCNNNMQAIPGATSRTFTPTSSGSYAVELSNGTCSVISECLGTTYLTKTSLSNIKIFPNPFTQNITIQIPENLQNSQLHIQVTDVLGRTIWTEKGTINELNKNLAASSKQWANKQVYHICITNATTQENTTFKVVKE